MSNKSTKLQDELMKSGALMNGSDPRLIPTRTPIGIAPLDDIMGGGLPNGACTMIVGPESTGKTILCQYAVAAIQRTERPRTLFIDAERSFDPDWWTLSGVDPDKVVVARPFTGEQTIDLIVEVMETVDDIGAVVIDSLAAMPPEKIVAESAERNDIGSHAKLTNLMYQKVVPKLDGRVFIATNQIREAIGGYEERYPGGKSPLYYNHLILRTRRTEWIKDGNDRVGFMMEVTTRKNKTAAPQQHAVIPFMFRGQVDMLAVLIDDAIVRGFIIPRLPYYEINGVDKKVLGKAGLRGFLLENPDVVERIK